MVQVPLPFPSSLQGYFTATEKTEKTTEPGKFSLQSVYRPAHMHPRGTKGKRDSQRGSVISNSLRVQRRRRLQHSVAVPSLLFHERFPSSLEDYHEVRRAQFRRLVV